MTQQIHDGVPVPPRRYVPQQPSAPQQPYAPPRPYAAPGAAPAGPLPPFGIPPQRSGPPPAPPFGAPGHGLPPAAPRRRRTGLVVGSVVAAVVVLAGLVGAALLLFGTSSLDTAKLQQKIAQLSKDRAGVAATDVSCPERDIRAGDQFTCTARLDGQPARFTVRQQDDKGNVHIRLDNSLLIVSEFEKLLSRKVGSDAGVDVTSSCDAGGHSVLVDGVGKQIPCTVTNGADPTDRIDVVAGVDEKGNVSYEQS